MQKYSSDKFEILGIDRDPIEKSKDLITNGTVLWRCICDPEGDVAKAWSVRSYPTVFVLDRKGIIRFRLNPDNSAQMDQTIETLVESDHRHKRSK